MAKRTGRDLLKEAQAKFVGAPVPAGTPRAPRIQPARGAQSLGGARPPRSGSDRAAASFVSAPRVGGARASEGVTGRRSGTSIPASQGIQNLGPNARAMTTTRPRTALDGTTGLMTQGQIERLAQRVRSARGGTAPINAGQDTSRLSLPAPTTSRLPIPVSTTETPTPRAPRTANTLPTAAARNMQAQPSAPTVVNSPPASSRVRPSRVRLGSAARLNVLGFAMGLPQAIQREAEYQRERSRRDREKP
jgi:hypothetical protein